MAEATCGAPLDNRHCVIDVIRAGSGWRSAHCFTHDFATEGMSLRFD